MLDLGWIAQKSLCYCALPMQKLRSPAFLCVIDSVYRTEYTQRLVQDDTQGCLQAVQRGNTESDRVTLPSSLLLYRPYAPDPVISPLTPFMGMDSENALRLLHAPEESCITIMPCFRSTTGNSARHSSSMTDAVTELLQQCQSVQVRIATILYLV